MNENINREKIKSFNDAIDKTTKRYILELLDVIKDKMDEDTMPLAQPLIIETINKVILNMIDLVPGMNKELWNGAVKPNIGLFLDAIYFDENGSTVDKNRYQSEVKRNFLNQVEKSELSEEAKKKMREKLSD